MHFTNKPLQESAKEYADEIFIIREIKIMGNSNSIQELQASTGRYG